MNGPIDGTKPTAPVPWTQAGNVALTIAVSWLVVVTLGCLGSLVFVFTPEVLANTAVLSVPLFASGWGATVGAVRARRGEHPTPLISLAVGAGVGLAVGAIGLTVAYMILWPPR